MALTAEIRNLVRLSAGLSIGALCFHAWLQLSNKLPIEFMGANITHAANLGYLVAFVILCPVLLYKGWKKSPKRELHKLIPINGNVDTIHCEPGFSEIILSYINHFKKNPINLRYMKVKEIMTTKHVKHCTTESKLHNVARAMKTANCGAIPVIDKYNKVVGIVTDRDICLSLAKKHRLPIGSIHVKSIMSPQVFTVRPEDDLLYALGQMRTHRVGRLPVVDEKGKLKGMLSMHNLLSKTFNTMNPEELNSPLENISKTVKALNDRYGNPSK